MRAAMGYIFMQNQPAFSERYREFSQVFAIAGCVFVHPNIPDDEGLLSYREADLESVRLLFPKEMTELPLRDDPILGFRGSAPTVQTVLDLSKKAAEGAAQIEQVLDEVNGFFDRFFADYSLLTHSDDVYQVAGN